MTDEDRIHMNRPVQKVPGYNVDRVDVAAGFRELKMCGYDEPETVMVIEYALRRWARGEEEAAQRGAVDRSFHGINLTCWLRVLAAAMACADGNTRDYKTQATKISDQLKSRPTALSEQRNVRQSGGGDAVVRRRATRRGYRRETLVSRSC